MNYTVIGLRTVEKRETRRRNYHLMDTQILQWFVWMSHPNNDYLQEYQMTNFFHRSIDGKTKQCCRKKRTETRRIQSQPLPGDISILSTKFNATNKAKNWYIIKNSYSSKIK